MKSNDPEGDVRAPFADGSDAPARSHSADLTTPAVNAAAPVGEVGIDTVYAELYQEMRRFRDWETEQTKWSVGLATALIGAIALTREKSWIQFTPSVRIWLSVLTVLLATWSLFIVNYAAKRYRALRDATRVLEPKWLPPNLPRLHRWNNPTTAFRLLITFMCLIAVLFVWL